jgi:CDP-diacylglycerol--serine O-phosphatidyltransferase
LIQTPKTDDPPGTIGDLNDPEPAIHGRRRHGRGRRLILRSTAVLPALFTLGNALCGFAAIHFATKDALGQASLTHLELAAWLIFIAMGCDMLDGRLARLTRRTSDFGGQLDSLADVISFGVAPAVLMLRTVVMILRGHLEIPGPLPELVIERVMWVIAAVYVSCAALRLARFNVENEPDESAHLHFKGLPSPGAAAVIVGLVLLFVKMEAIQTVIEQAPPATAHRSVLMSSPWFLGMVSATLPIMTLVAGLLMVSSLPYPHMINQYLHAKRPFGYIVRLTVIALAAMLEVYVTLAAVVTIYALSGPVRGLRRRLARRKQAAPQGP